MPFSRCFIQSNFQSCAHTFYVWVVLGIELTTLALEAPYSTILSPLSPFTQYTCMTNWLYCNREHVYQCVLWLAGSPTAFLCRSFIVSWRMDWGLPRGRRSASRTTARPSWSGEPATNCHTWRPTFRLGVTHLQDTIPERRIETSCTTTPACSGYSPLRWRIHLPLMWQTPRVSNWPAQPHAVALTQLPTIGSSVIIEGQP
jgi:hypothetical protein